MSGWHQHSTSSLIKLILAQKKASGIEIHNWSVSVGTCLCLPHDN